MKKEDLLLEAIEKRKDFQKKLEENYKVKNFKYSNSEKQEEKESLEFKKVPPVLWFGDLNAEKPKVVVISANPHNPERCICKTQVWDENNPNIPQLIEDYNNYFKQGNNPATNWFGQNSNEHKAENQARIEDFLNGLGASFYDKDDKEKYPYQAIHIDLLPLATTTDFSKIAKNLMKINGLREFIKYHIKELIKLIRPELVIVNGVTNKKYFEECLGIYPIKPKNPEKECFTVNNKKKYNLRIWDFDNIEDSKVIAISRNMGTSCRVNKESLYSIGELERKRLKL